MAFKKMSHVADLEAGPSDKRYPDVAPITADEAAIAKKVEPTELERKHAEALDRAEKIKDDSLKESVGSKDIAARFKIEVMFGPKRTIAGPNIVKVMFWESGQRLHGGGDDLMYMCRNEDGTQGCGAIFTSEAVRGNIAICPSCRRAMYSEKLTRSMRAKLTSRDLARDVAKFWRQLNGNADVYLKYDPSDVKSVALNKDEPGRRLKPRRGKAIYPLRRIIADTSNGMTIENAFFGFITS